MMKMVTTKMMVTTTKMVSKVPEIHEDEIHEHEIHEHEIEPSCHFSQKTKTDYYYYIS